MSGESTPGSRGDSASPMKRPWRPPSLTCHGSLKTITRGVGGTNPDVGQMNNTKRTVT